MRAPLAAFREPARKLWQLCKVLYVFEHKTQYTQYLLIHAPFIHITVHIGNVPPMISESQICYYAATFCIAPIFVIYCYTISSGLL